MTVRGLIRDGHRGDHVRAVQRGVGVKADGEFGEQTRLAVMRLQRARGLKVDGVVGAQTLAALRGDEGASEVPPGPAEPGAIAWLAERTARLREVAERHGLAEDSPLLVEVELAEPRILEAVRGITDSLIAADARWEANASERVAERLMETHPHVDEGTVLGTAAWCVTQTRGARDDRIRAFAGRLQESVAAGEDVQADVKAAVEDFAEGARVREDAAFQRACRMLPAPAPLSRAQKAAERVEQAAEARREAAGRASGAVRRRDGRAA